MQLVLFGCIVHLISTFIFSLNVCFLSLSHQIIFQTIITGMYYDIYFLLLSMYCTLVYTYIHTHVLYTGVCVCVLLLMIYSTTEL